MTIGRVDGFAFRLVTLLLSVFFVASPAFGQLVEEWDARHSRLYAAQSSPCTFPAERCQAIDSNGNVFVTGETYAGIGPGSNDIATVKYSSSGVHLWTRAYNGPANDNDGATAIAVDTGGNCVVVGWRNMGAAGADDWIIIKYDPNGQELWTATYIGVGNNADRARAVAIDPAGAIYVTGSVYNGTSTVFTTVKFSPSGAQLWATQSPPGMLPTAIALDAVSNVVVTGYSTTVSSNSNYVTVKLDSNGNQSWIRTFAGTGAANDFAQAVAVDELGNIYVTGSADGGPDDDCVTIKYSAAGTQLWTALYNGPSGYWDRGYSIAVDSAGNAYVAGRTRTSANEDFLLIKYNSGGSQQWVRLFNGSANKDDYGASVALDAAGGVYVAGSSDDAFAPDICLVKYDTSGTFYWSALTAGSSNGGDIGHSVLVASSGQILIAGRRVDSATSGYSVSAYSAGGASLWSQYFEGAASDCVMASAGNEGAMAVDANGNVYATGQSYRSPTNADCETVKYNTNGVLLWSASYNGTADGHDEAFALAVDSVGNTYITGWSYNGANLDCLTVKYNSAGIQLWVAMYNGSSNNVDIGLGIAVDSAGNVYIAGTTRNGASDDFMVIKYNSGGVQQWVDLYNGSGNSIDRARVITVDPLDFIYVAGDVTTATGSDFRTVKYNSAGVIQWAAQYNGTASGSDVATELKVDSVGSVYVAGLTNSSTNSNFAVVKYNSVGTQQWVAIWDGATNQSDIPKGLALDSFGNIVVTGETQGATMDYATVKFNSSGVFQWAALFNGPANGNDYARSVGTDDAGNIYVAGQSQRAGSDSQITTIKYSSAGVQQWSLSKNTPINDSANAMLVAPGRFVLVGGNGGGRSSGGQSFIIVKYHDNTPPALSLVATSVGYVENAVATRLDPNATVTDITSPDMSSGSLFVEYIANATASDQLTLSTTATVRLNGLNVEYDVDGFGVGVAEVVVASVPAGGAGSGTGGQSLLITFNSNSSPNVAQAVLRAIAFYNNSENPSALTRTIRLTVDDGDGGVSSQPTIDVSVTPVNDAPTLTVVSALPGAAEDTPFSLPFATLLSASNAGDVDSAAISFRVEAVSSGSMTINGSAVTPGATLFVGGDLLEWSPDPNANGNLAAFEVVAWDGALASSGPVQVTISVAPVNDAPTLTAITALSGATESVPFTITFATLWGAANLADIDSPSLSFRIEAVTLGSLVLNGSVPIVAGTTVFSSGDTLTWTPPPGSNGQLNAFSVVAWDGSLVSSSPTPVLVGVSSASSGGGSGGKKNQDDGGCTTEQAFSLNLVVVWYSAMFCIYMRVRRRNSRRSSEIDGFQRRLDPLSR